MDVDPIIQGTHSSLANLTALGYVYRIYRPANLSSATPDIFITGNAGGDYALGDMHMEVIEVPNAQVGERSPSQNFFARSSLMLRHIHIHLCGCECVCAYQGTSLEIFAV